MDEVDVETQFWGCNKEGPLCCDLQSRLYQSPVSLPCLLPKELLKEQGRGRPHGQGEALRAALRWGMLKLHVSQVEVRKVCLQHACQCAESNWLSMLEVEAKIKEPGGLSTGVLRPNLLSVGLLVTKSGNALMKLSDKKWETW